jgi:hypothetical protein
MPLSILVVCRKLIIVTLVFTAATYGQNTPCPSQTKDKERIAPAYRIGYSWRTAAGPAILANQISIKANHFNCADMLALARQFNRDYPNETRLAIYIFDSYSAAQNFSLVQHSPTYTKDFKAFRGFYKLDRDTGDEYIEFSSARGKPGNEFRIEFGGKTPR